MTEDERRAALEAVADEVRVCTRCRLHEGRTKAVPGEGSPSTEVLFVGEGPGLNEDRQGRPFVGAAGQFLTELLGSVGWRREDVFITNVVKCRPPQNRDPEPDEIAACDPFLRRQMAILEPALVVTLGRHSMGRFLPGARIGQVHGTVRPAPDGSGAGDGAVFAMYHPAAALHQGSLRQTLLDDMARVPDALVDVRRRRAESRPEGSAEGAAAAEVAPAAAAEETPAAPEAEPLADAAPGGVGLESQELVKVVVEPLGVAIAREPIEPEPDAREPDAREPVQSEHSGRLAVLRADRRHRDRRRPRRDPGGRARAVGRPR